MLAITNSQHLISVLKEVDRLDKVYGHRFSLLTRLNEILDYLDKFGGEGTTLKLGFDWAPLSFGYTIERNGAHWMSGAIILHCPPGFLEGSCVEPMERIEWSMHS